MVSPGTQPRRHGFGSTLPPGRFQGQSQLAFDTMERQQFRHRLVSHLRHHSSILPFIHPSIQQFTLYASTHPSKHPWIHLYLHQSIHSLIHSSISAFIHLSIHSLIHSIIHSINYCIIFSCIHTFIHQLIFIFTYSFIYLSIQTDWWIWKACRYWQWSYELRPGWTIYSQCNDSWKILHIEQCKTINGLSTWSLAYFLLSFVNLFFHKYTSALCSGFLSSFLFCFWFSIESDFFAQHFE